MVTYSETGYDYRTAATVYERHAGEGECRGRVCMFECEGRGEGECMCVCVFLCVNVCVCVCIFYV